VNLENSSKLVPEEPVLPPTAELRRICHGAVAALVARRGWTFLSKAEIPEVGDTVMQEVRHRWQAGERVAIAKMADESAMGIYVERWVVACRADGDIAQTQGYRALSDYIAVKLPYLLEMHDASFGGNLHISATLRQEILLKVRAALPTLQTPRTFLKWLLRLSHTVIRDFVTQHQGDALAYSDPLDEELLMAEIPPRYFLVDPVLLEQLKRVLAKCLNDEFRLQVIEAFFLEEMKVQEMAAQWGMETATISQAKFRALQSLRRCLALLEFLEDLT
jgi:RNA polymerase sigma factor (sigma-70 family)